MKVAIIGTGYVGLVAAVCFSEMGNTVNCIDIDINKLTKLQKGISPIYEPGLNELLIKNIKSKNLFFTDSIKNGICDCEVVFIAVGTPMDSDGSANLDAVFSVVKSIGKHIIHKSLVVTKSTVPVGTTYKIKELINVELSLRKLDLEIDVVSNPEFLKEGSAIEDFMKPDRIIIGADTIDSFSKMKQLYAPFFRTHDRFITMDVLSSEMTKYAANAMLATKISFMNEMANICEKVGADINNVRIGIGSDKRIGYHFIYPGVGYGGTCFPKDIAALIKLGNDKGFHLQLISAVNEVNEQQKIYFLEKIINRFGENLEDHIFTIWGLSFKPETDDMRDSPAIYIINELVKRGAKIRAYDPKAMKEAQEFYLKNVNNIEYFDSKYEALQRGDALILLTEWKEFRSPDFSEIKKQLKRYIIFDGRNQYNAFDLKEMEFEYYQIGKK
ncbi:UDP-glucose 6-dehydrogenase [Polaribacter pacificus]|uniref:UDP-glucose 6-dehydrogenase n=1 Tax=Polaribacter pacificus TaxID=1775173 RepID=A0A917I1L1_9FLAO|nr:UDP-glucose/GDP-mannose dehydrogenase family protein [Polaribacter pacificus]GGH01738.1 UDP-glucose 6-dehydrogenase [Polaribacter pacificus]